MMRWGIGPGAVPIVSHQHQHVYFGKAAYTADRVYHSPMATFAGDPGSQGQASFQERPLDYGRRPK